MDQSSRWLGGDAAPESRVIPDVTIFVLCLTFTAELGERSHLIVRRLSPLPCHPLPLRCAVVPCSAHFVCVVSAHEGQLCLSRLRQCHDFSKGTRVGDLCLFDKLHANMIAEHSFKKNCGKKWIGVSEVKLLC